MTARRVRREPGEMVEALRRHTKLLRAFCMKAFDEGDLDYLGEIATKPPVLTFEGDRNKALLLRIFRTHNLGYQVEITGLTNRWPCSPDIDSMITFDEL